MSVLVCRFKIYCLILCAAFVKGLEPKRFGSKPQSGAFAALTVLFTEGDRTKNLTLRIHETSRSCNKPCGVSEAKSLGSNLFDKGCKANSHPLCNKLRFSKSIEEILLQGTC